jgi:hypothetical protein
MTLVSNERLAMSRALYDHVFAAFAKACRQDEFELAEHLLRASESHCAVKHDSNNSMPLTHYWRS